MKKHVSTSRRRFLKAGAATAAGALLPAWTMSRGAPAIIAAEIDRPQALQGVSFGDPSDGSVVVWSRSDRAARMIVEWSYDDQFRDAARIVCPHALETSDFTVRQDLERLEAGRDVFVRVSFQSLTNARAVGEPVVGRFVVPPDPLDDDDHRWRWMRDGRSDLRFLWAGDT